MNPNFEEHECGCTSPMLACAIVGAIIATVVLFSIWYLPLRAHINHLENEIERLELQLKYTK